MSTLKAPLPLPLGGAESSMGETPFGQGGLGGRARGVMVLCSGHVHPELPWDAGDGHISWTQREVRLSLTRTALQVTGGLQPLPQLPGLTTAHPPQPHKASLSPKTLMVFHVTPSSVGAV